MKFTYRFYIADENTPLLITEATTEQLEAEVKRRKDQKNRERYNLLIAERNRLEEQQCLICRQLDQIEDQLDELAPMVQG
jgi:hypothetical protein